MLLQNIKAALFAGAIILFSQAALTAQIEKGVTTLGGAASFESSKSTSSTSSSNYNAFNLSPSYGRFITDKIMVKGRLNSILQNGTVDNTSSDFDYRYDSKLSNLEAEARYYLNPNAKWKFFGGISAGMTFTKSKITYVNNLYTESNFKNNGPNFSVFAGVNKFLNSEIALEGTLGYSYTDIGFPFGGFGFRNKARNIGLNVSLNNFTNFKSSDKDFVGLIDKGRSIIGGRLTLNAYSYGSNSSTKENGSFAIFDVDYGRFVKKGLLIGTKVNIILEKSYQSYGISQYIQYFYPISNRLMLHAKAELGFSINQNHSTFVTPKVGLGATYFLSKNVALSADLLNLSKTYYSSEGFGKSQTKHFGSNIGLRFFLK